MIFSLEHRKQTMPPSETHSNLSIRGVIPPLITPLKDRDTLDVGGLERLVVHLLSGGVDGLFILGTTGEGPSLSHRLQRDLVTSTARMLDGRLPLYVGITDTSLVESIELARFAAAAGADAVVAAPPFYFPAGQTELRHWYDELLDGLPLPLLLYNMPGCTKIALERETLSVLMEHEQVVGLKDSSGDMAYLKSVLGLVAEKRPDWPLLVGPEHLLADAVALGAAGGVPGGANLAPRLFVELFQAASARDTQSLEELQTRVERLQELYSIGKYGSAFVKGVKCALELCGVCSGQLAAPFDAFRAPERRRVSAWLDSFASTGLLPENARRHLSGTEPV